MKSEEQLESDAAQWIKENGNLKLLLVLLLGETAPKGRTMGMELLLVEKMMLLKPKKVS